MKNKKKQQNKKNEIHAANLPVRIDQHYPILPAKCVNFFLLWQTMICASWFSGASTNKRTLKSQQISKTTLDLCSIAQASKSQTKPHNRADLCVKSNGDNGISKRFDARGTAQLASGVRGSDQLVC